MSAGNSRAVSQSEMARMLGVSRRKVASWRDEGWLVPVQDELAPTHLGKNDIPFPSSIKFDLVASIQEVTKHEQVLVSQAALAGLFGWQRSYATKLKNADRLVMVPVEGKKNDSVDLGASLERIRLTEARRPREDVADRHADARGMDATKGIEAPDPERESVSRRKQIASMKLEEAKAATAEAEHRKLIGELVEIEAVRLAGAHLGAMLRSSLENAQDQIGPELAVESDPARIHALLGSHFDHLLREISREMEILARGRS